MKVKTILVSQPEPKVENPPYSRLIEKEKVKVDFRPFIHVEGVEAKNVYFYLLEMILRAPNWNFYNFGHFSLCDLE